MKTTLLKLTMAVAIATTVTALNAQNVNIPDANFKAYLVGNTAINTNTDTEIQVSEAAAFTGMINVMNSNISDLTGIEAFPAITMLYCGINQLTSLDVSANTALTILECNNNQITSLDVSANTSLYYLACSTNQLTSLDVSNNLLLTDLNCAGNQLTSLNVSANTSLNELKCETNQLTSLNVSANTQLDVLSCSSNQLTSLNVSSNTQLKSLYCQLSQITSLDVSSNTMLEDLFCSYNEITNLDLTSHTNLKQLDCRYNQLNSLNVANGNNSIITIFWASDNSNLDCIQVDDVAYSTSNWVSGNFLFDPQASFTEGVQTSLNGSVVSVDSPSLSATFQWVDCDNSNASISGATAESFTPTVSGNYAVEVTDNGCTTTSSCTAVTIGTSGIEEQNTNALNIFPNPAQSIVSLNNLAVGSRLQLIDITGKTVLETIVSSSEMTIDLNKINNGVYFVQLGNNSEITISKKLVINK